MEITKITDIREKQLIKCNFVYANFLINVVHL